MMFLAAGSMNVKAWDLGMDFHFPSPAYEGERYTAIVGIRNTGLDPIRLEGLGLHFDWMSANAFYYAQGLPITLLADDVWGYYFQVEVPYGASGGGAYANRVVVLTVASDLDALGGWGASTSGYTTYAVSITPAFGGPIESPYDHGNDGTNGLLLLVVVLVLASATVVLARRRKRPPTPVDRPPSVDSSDVVAWVEKATTPDSEGALSLEAQRPRRWRRNSNAVFPFWV